MTTFVRKQAAVMAVAVMLALLGAPSAAAAGPGAGPSWTHQDVHVCNPAAGQAACTSIARVLYENGIPYQAATPAQLQAAARAAASISFTAVGIRTAYGITGQGDPSKVIAIVDAYDDPNALAHLTTYRNQMLPPSQAPIQSCTWNVLTGTTSQSKPCFTQVNQTGGPGLPSVNSGWSNEIDLDLQAASAICPMCSLLLLEASSSSFGDLGIAATTASTATTASSWAHVVAISNSFGTQGDVAESVYSAWNTAATKGIAVMAAAGDWGYGTSFPASSTNVIGVGGTTLAVSGTTGARTGETAWSSTGSGCSSYNAAPSWQVIPGSPCGSMKAVSDLSADADPYSGLQIYTTYSGTTGWWIFGGTSLATPIMSAFYAMQGGYGGSTLAGQYAWASTTPYYPVTSGSNGTCSPSIMCNAGTGWDGPTGLGSIATSTVVTNDFSISASPASLSVAEGGQGTSTINTALVSGSPGSIALSISGLPTGVTAAFSPSSVTAGASSTLTLAVGSGVPTGTYALTVTGTAPSATHSTPLSLTVTAPVTNDFSISASPSSLSVVQGAQGNSTIGTTLVSGSAETVALSVSGQPSGVSAAFSPASVTAGTSATLTLTVGSGVPTGTYALTVTGTAPSATHSTPLSLTVTAPATSDFSLTASPGSRSIKRGQSTSYSITITRLNGFSDQVAFTLGGLPSGAGYTFSPPSTIGTSSTLSITSTGSAASGTYTLTVTGSNASGTLTHTVAVTLKLR